MLSTSTLLFSVSLTATAVLAQAHTPENSMHRHAHGTFTVKLEPLPSPDGLQRMSIDKELHGGLQATSKGEMISAGDPKTGAAGYVAMETVSGTLDGKKGTFALQHFALMDKSGPKLQIVVVPGSGTGELTGLEGTFTIRIADGNHSYDFEYTEPAPQP